MIGLSSLSFEEFGTLVTEVESIVKARPLTYVYDDLDGVNSSLTTSHLINKRRLQNTANSSQFEVVSTYESLTRRSEYQKRPLNHFTVAWRKEYLISLREARATNARRRGGCTDIAVGDVVQLQNDSTKRTL